MDPLHDALYGELLRDATEMDREEACRKDPVSLVGDFDTSRPLLSQVSAVVATRAHFFGNQIACLVNAIKFCKQTGIRKLYWPGAPEYLADTFQVDEVHVMVGDGTGAHGNILRASFLYDRSSLKDIVPACTESFVDICRKMNFRIDRAKTDAESDSTLHIHIRAGDIFQGTNIRFNYGQPPLIFYTKILSLRHWRRVVVISQKGQNPCVKPMIDFIYSKGMDFEFIMPNFLDTLDAILAANHLVVSRGSFLLPAMAISRNLRSCYVFEDFYDSYVRCGFSKTEINFRRFRGGEEFRRDNIINWANRPEQVRKMLTLDESNLSEVD